jgi:hypothetical protein
MALDLKYHMAHLVAGETVILMLHTDKVWSDMGNIEQTVNDELLSTAYMMSTILVSSSFSVSKITVHRFPLLL